MVVRQIIDWRKRNGLSQRAAVEVMRARGLRVSQSTLEAWEQGRNAPVQLSVPTLQSFLSQNPRIENPPVFKPGPKKRPK
jgi:DNA-binding transcriptional regulator YiaG